MKKLLFFLLLLPELVMAQGNIYLRASTGAKPITYELKNLAGTTLQSKTSNKEEEQFTAPAFGYSWKITDANGKTATGSTDAVSHQLLNKPIRMKAVYFYTGAAEASGTITDVQAIPGFNTASVNVHGYQLFGTSEKFNNARWTQIYDHTVPNQTFTSDQNLNSMDELIYRAYNTGNNLQTRVQIRIMFAGSMRIDEIQQNWGYQLEDLPVRPSGALADSRPSLGYQVRFPSYASDRALNFFKEQLKKFCYRYQKAINDGTIRDIGIVMNESGETNQSGGYYDDNGAYSMSIGDYNTKAQLKFIDFCKARYGTIQAMNQKLGSNIKSFTLDDGGSFGRNMLAYGADGGNNKVRALWQWYQMELHDLFEYEMQKYAYQQVALTRARLWCFDVGSIYNGDMFRMKSMNFRQRLLKNPTQWMTVKTNNSFEGTDTPQYVIDQAITAAGVVGAQPCWEPSPFFGVFTVDNMSNLAVKYCIDNSVGLSAFSANPSELPVGNQFPPVEFWTRVSNQTNLASKTTTFKPNDLDANGNRIIASIPYFSTALNGFDDHTGDFFVFQAWKAAHDANPGKVISIFVDDSDLRATFVTPYGYQGETGSTNPNPEPVTIPTPTLTGTQTNDNASVNLTWNGNGAINITGWNVQRSSNGGEFTNVLTNAIPSLTSQTFTHSPANATYTYRVQTITSNGTSGYSTTASFAPLTGVGGDDYVVESSESHNSGNYNPWAKFGKYQVPYKKIAVANDFIGSEGNIKYALGTDLTNSLSNLGIRFPGIYYKVNDDYYQREPVQNRYLYLGQRQYEDTEPYLGSNYLPDNNPSGYGTEWTLDTGEKFTPSNGDFRLWNIVWAWYHRNPTGNGFYNSNFGIVRPNVEGHPVVGDFNYYIKARYVWQGGKYRPARAGGTDNTTSDGDPAYAQMSDLDWYNHVNQCQVSFDDWWYTPWKSAGRETIGYQAESQAGFMNEIQGVTGYRRTNLFNQAAFNGRKYTDFMTATCYLGGDVMLDLIPFALAYTDQFDERYPEIAAYRLVRELGIAEDGSTRTGVTVNTEPEFYRLTISQDRKVKLQFEDRFGNTTPTKRPMQIESALPKANTGYGTTDVWAQIPVGSTEIEVQVNNDFLSRRSITEKCDDDLINRWEYAALYYRDMKARGFEGFPVQNQVYAHAVGQRGSQFNLEVTVTGQMPKEYARGLRFMGATFNYMHVMYSTTNLMGYRTMDHIYGAQKTLSKYNNHWNDNKKAVDLEISLDGGNTWTSSTVASFRTDLSASGDFLANNPQGYNATWVRNRKGAGQASPLVFVSYNDVTKTAVIFEKAVYGSSINYGLRFKKPDGTYATYLNRSITNKWQDTSVTVN